MSDDDHRATCVLEHRDADLTRESPFRLPMYVLGPQLNGATLYFVANRGQRGEWRRQHDRAMGCTPRSVPHGARQRARFFHGLVHLPVAGYHGESHLVTFPGVVISAETPCMQWAG